MDLQHPQNNHIPPMLLNLPKYQSLVIGKLQNFHHLIAVPKKIFFVLVII